MRNQNICTLFELAFFYIDIFMLKTSKKDYVISIFVKLKQSLCLLYNFFQFLKEPKKAS